MIEWYDTMKQTKGNVLWFSKDLFGDNVLDNANMPAEDGTMICIDCADEHCDSSKMSKSLAMPFYVYAADIPRSVTNIAVLVNEKCASLIPECSAHGIALRDFLARMYPRADGKLGALAGVVRVGLVEFVMQRNKSSKINIFSPSFLPTLFYRLQMNLIIFKLKHTQSFKNMVCRKNFRKPIVKNVFF